MRVNYAIVFVSDMKRAVSFYKDVLGLPLKFESPGWTEFATDGATLALHASEGSNAERENPEMSQAGRCRPGLSVPNLDEFHKGWSRGMCPAFRSRGRFLELGSHSTGIPMGCRYPSVRSSVGRDTKQRLYRSEPVHPEQIASRNLLRPTRSRSTHV